MLADWAAIAIDHARLYRDSVERSQELERAIEGLEATTAISRALGVGDRSRAGARAGGQARPRARARPDRRAAARGGRPPRRGGRRRADRRGGAQRRRCPSRAPSPARCWQSGRPRADRATSPRASGSPTRRSACPGTETALLVPLRSRGRSLGVLCAFDRLDDDPEFGDREEELLLLFAQSAATAVATARSVEAERLRHSLRSAEQERTRWARELHDETLQGLAALRVLLQSGLKVGGDALEQAARQATEQVATEIANLRSLITELRPAALDQLGLAAALEGLAQRAREVDGLEVEIALERRRRGARPRPAHRRLPAGPGGADQRRQARPRAAGRGADRAARAEGLEVRVADDGGGFDTAAPTEGFGVAGMRERAALMGGDLEIRSGRRRARPSARSCRDPRPGALRSSPQRRAAPHACPAPAGGRQCRMTTAIAPALPRLRRTARRLRAPHARERRRRRPPSRPRGSPRCGAPARPARSCGMRPARTPRGSQGG